MILDMDTLYRIHSNEHSRYVTVRAHQHRHRPAPTPLANAQETIDFSLTLSGYSRLILNLTHSYAYMYVIVWKNSGPILRRNRPPNEKRLYTRVTLMNTV